MDELNLMSTFRPSRQSSRGFLLLHSRVSEAWLVSSMTEHLLPCFSFWGDNARRIHSSPDAQCCSRQPSLALLEMQKLIFIHPDLELGFCQVLSKTFGDPYPHQGQQLQLERAVVCRFPLSRMKPLMAQTMSLYCLPCIARAISFLIGGTTNFATKGNLTMKAFS